MSEYTVPVCECGGELGYREGHSIEENYEIKANGKPKKRMMKCGRDYIIRDFTLLYCSKCYERYDYDTDAHGRFILGEKYE